MHRYGYPQRDSSRLITGVFSTRSPDRPNPLGLHRARVLAINHESLYIGPIEVVDGTPVVDINPVVEQSNDF
jgi:tRNA (Thr-GGU) A37 N-methylase